MSSHKLRDGAIDVLGILAVLAIIALTVLAYYGLCHLTGVIK